MSKRSFEAEVIRRLSRIERFLGVIEDDIMTLKDDIARAEKIALDETDQITAVESLITSLINMVRNTNVSDPRLAAALDKFEANKTRLSALALTNTQADPNTPEASPEIEIPPAV